MKDGLWRVETRKKWEGRKQNEATESDNLKKIPLGTTHTHGEKKLGTNPSVGVFTGS